MPALSAAADKRRVAFQSVAGAVFITALKLFMGLATGSLGILSEAAHSGLDLVAAGITYLAVSVSDKPADADHTYGHQKVENFSAFLEIGLLLATSAWIIFEALRRLLGHPVEVEASPAAFAVMIASIVIDYTRSRALRRAATAYKSQALEADALHFSTDMWSSAVVILGLALVWLGRRYKISHLATADAAAALAVAGIIIFVSARLARRSVGALLDAAPEGLADRLHHALSGAAGVLSVERVRARHAGSQYFVDATLGVDAQAPQEHAKAVAEAAEAAVHEILPGADVMIRTDPRPESGENLFGIVKRVAARRRFSVHDLAAYEVPGGVGLEFHLEVKGDLPLEEAHRIVSSLESEIQREAPQVAVITTHIENEGAPSRHSPLPPEDLRAWAEPLAALARSFPEVLDCHDVTVLGPPEELAASCHCVFPGDLSVRRVHELENQIEARFRREFPQLQRVVIHPEPHSELAGLK